MCINFYIYLLEKSTTPLLLEENMKTAIMIILRVIFILREDRTPSLHVIYNYYITNIGDSRISS